MSDTIMFFVFVGALIVAARLCLRGEHRPPIPAEDERQARSGDSTRPYSGRDQQYD